MQSPTTDHSFCTGMEVRSMLLKWATAEFVGSHDMRSFHVPINLPLCYTDADEPKLGGNEVKDNVGGTVALAYLPTSRRAASRAGDGSSL